MQGKYVNSFAAENNAQTQLSTAVADTDTTITVDDASVFPDDPSQTGNSEFRITVIDSQGELEIMNVSAVSTNDLTVERGQEGTTALSFDTGQPVEQRFTAEAHMDLVDGSSHEGHDHSETDLTSIPNTGLDNSSVEVAGNSVNLGGSTDVNYTDLLNRSHGNEDHDVNYTDYDSDNFDTDFGDKTTDDLTEGTTNEYFKVHGNESHPEDYTTTDEDVENFSTSGEAETVPVSQGDGTLAMEEAGVEDEFAFGAYPSSLELSTLDALAQDEFVMEDVTNRGDAINQITESEKAMDKVTDKEIAMNKVTDKEIAMDKVTDKEMAMDKVTDKEMPMDKVTDKEIAMDKVTDKEMPMDKVTDKEIAMEVLSDKQFSFDFVLDNISKSAVQQFLVDETTAKNMAVGKFVQGGAFIDNTGISSENVTNIDTLTDSNDRMNEVTDSERAMDGVTESGLAMDKLTDKEMAMNKVTDKEMAMDKVTDKEMAMDKVTDKEVAMDKVMSKMMAKTKILSSEFTISQLWSKAMPTDKYWDTGTITGNDGDDIRSFEITLDFSNANTLKIKTSSPGTSIDFGEGRIYIDGDELLFFESGSTWDERNLDVSNYSGELTLRLEYTSSDLLVDFVTGATGNGNAISFYRDGESSDPDGSPTLAFSDIKLEV